MGELRGARANEGRQLHCIIFVSIIKQTAFEFIGITSL